MVATLGMFETYYWYQSRAVPVERFEGSITTSYYRKHELLGYAPTKDYRASVSKYVGDELVYTTNYTIDRNGLRVAPPHDNSSPNGALVFFGGSVTFGEGVGDSQTMPYQVGLKTNGRYPTYNFAFHGYGPHQMLAALEHGLVEQVVEQQPKLVIYQAIPAHVGRAAGLASWDKHGPKYQLDRKGNSYLAGRFDDVNGWFSEIVASNLHDSHLYKRLFGSHRPIRNSDIQLYVAIVKQARELVMRRFSGSLFHVIFWDVDKDDKQHDMSKAMLEGLHRARIPIHLVSAILPDYRDNQSKYVLSDLDHHPNPQAHEAIANYVVAMIAERR